MSKRDIATVKKLDWEAVKAMGTIQGAEWMFVPAGTQFLDDLAKTPVKALKWALEHMLLVSTIEFKPTLKYAELCTL